MIKNSFSEQEVRNIKKSLHINKITRESSVYNIQIPINIEQAGILYAIFL